MSGWDELVDYYRVYDAVEPNLKAASLAEWIVNSERGHSLLGRRHLNFSGLKYNDRLRKFADPVREWGPGGALAQYCTFPTVADFVAGYWRDFAIKYPAQWDAHLKDPVRFIDLIEPRLVTPSDMVIAALPEAYDMLRMKPPRRIVMMGGNVGNSSGSDPGKIVVTRGNIRAGRDITFTSGSGGGGGPPPLPPPSSSGTPGTEAAAAAIERVINVWIGEGEQGRQEPLVEDARYRLNFRVGRKVSGSLAESVPPIPDSDVPEQGLHTEWVLKSDNVEFVAGSVGTRAEFEQIGNRPAPHGHHAWVARFSLTIPRNADSETAWLTIAATPLINSETGLGQATFDATVFVGTELYRTFQITLQVASADATLPKQTPTPSIVKEETAYVPTAHTHLHSTNEWTRPPGKLTILVANSVATVTGDLGPGSVLDGRIVPWPTTAADLTGRIENVRKSAERFRSEAQDYLNAIDPDELDYRLHAWQPQEDWSILVDSMADPATRTTWEGRADTLHRQSWEAVRTSKALRDLAYDGRALFDACFPETSELRGWIMSLKPGHRLNLVWSRESGGNPAAHVPWGLMYVGNVPTTVVDPMGFLGLRLRIGYTAHAGANVSKALGGEETSCINLLYWGQKDLGQEARRQESEWIKIRKNQVFLGGPPDGRKSNLLKLLDTPEPAPASVLYLYCHCKVGAGNDPVLTFGDTTRDVDEITRQEIAISPLKDSPFVFVNACSSAASDPYVANQLEAGFFSRGCRAYLGTETKVPIEFASRLASIFFFFFYRKASPKPMAAGEALAQTRLFLWTHYRNIGGLLYSYVNQYELYMADHEEVSSLQH